MNLQRLSEAEKAFLEAYPEGFNDPELQKIGKKHKISQMTELTQELLAPDRFGLSKQVTESFGKIISKASVVSVFEKVKFRDYIKNVGPDQCDGIAYGLKELLHGNQQEGFETLVDILSEEKMAKWPIISVISYYNNPTYEVFIKPTTVKMIIKELELPGVIYKPRPSWEFYEAYREQINELKRHISDKISKDSGAFCGFLMMTLGER